MSKFYARSTGGFYASEINGKNMPEDAVAVDDSTYAELLIAQNSGKQIVSDPNGSPIAIDPALSADQIRAKYEQAAQSALDSTAKAWGYDSLMSAASYASSGVARYKTEADALVTWRDALWQAAYNIEVSVQNGTAMPATAADFLAMLPPAPMRPTV